MNSKGPNGDGHTANTVNVPLDRNERAHSEMRSRSTTNLHEPSSIERARTQSPIPREPVAVAEPPPKTRAPRKSVGEEIRVRTDYPPPLPKTQPPSINEIPPSPKTSITTALHVQQKARVRHLGGRPRRRRSLRHQSHRHHQYLPGALPQTPLGGDQILRSTRSKSPTSGRTSPSPSQSSASIPSPSSISPGSTSPDTPRRRSNPAFDKVIYFKYYIKNHLSRLKKKFSGFCLEPSASSRPILTKGRSASPLGSVEASKNGSEAKDVKKQRVINVPISAPWYHRSLSSSEATDTAHARRVVIGMDSFSSLHPDTFRRNYRFNIDLSSDSPLSIVNR
ncbi:hypothetical protein OSTOST_10926 [Ostertagia ostertagi]